VAAWTAVRVSAGSAVSALPPPSPPGGGATLDSVDLSDTTCAWGATCWRSAARAATAHSLAHLELAGCRHVDDHAVASARRGACDANARAGGVCGGAAARPPFAGRGR